jgi:uncharacterized protein YkwD
MPALVPRRVLILTAMIAVAWTLCGKAQSASLTRKESILLKVMNDVRGTTGLRPLRVDPRLERAARAHSETELRMQSMFHGNFAGRIRRVGVRAPKIGENLAWGTGTLARARAIVNLWLESPEHRANLLYRGYRTVGVGVMRGSFQGYASAALITTDFAGR